MTWNKIWQKKKKVNSAEILFNFLITLEETLTLQKQRDQFG